MEQRPKISVITVVFNGEAVIEKTIKSVSEQSFKNIEHWIIDGASRDSTIDLIKKYHHLKWISEKDKGLYDAMNKGLQLSKGEYVIFMNAGDVFNDKDVLKNIFESNLPEADVYYGETIVTDESDKTIGMRRLKTPDKLTWKSFAMGMLVCHQSIIIRKEITDQYNINYRLAADIDWIIKALKKANIVVNTKIIISRFQTGGLSRKNILPGLKERFKIMSEHYGLIPTILRHFLIGFKFLIHLLLYRRVE